MGGGVSVSGAAGAAALAGAAVMGAQGAVDLAGAAGDVESAAAGVVGGGSDVVSGPAWGQSATAKLQSQATNMALNAKIAPVTQAVDFTKP